MPSHLTREIIGAVIKIHRKLGPGLLESAYEACLADELQQVGWSNAECTALTFSCSVRNQY